MPCRRASFIRRNWALRRLATAIHAVASRVFGCPEAFRCRKPFSRLNDLEVYDGDGISPDGADSGAGAEVSTGAEISAAGLTASPTGSRQLRLAFEFATAVSATGSTGAFASVANSIHRFLRRGFSLRRGFDAGAASPSGAGFSWTGFFSGFGGRGAGFLAVSIRPSANSRTWP